MSVMSRAQDLLRPVFAVTAALEAFFLTEGEDGKKTAISLR